MTKNQLPIIPLGLWHGLAFEWLWVYHGEVPRVQQWSPEITVPAGWFWVEKGLVKIQVHGREITIKAGQSFLTAPGIRRQWFKLGTRLLSVGFRCQRPDGSPLFNAGLNMAMDQVKTTELLHASHSLFHVVHGEKSDVTYQQGIAAMAGNLSDWSKHEAAYRLWFSVYVGTLERYGIQPMPQSQVQDKKLVAWLSALNDWPLDQSFKLECLARDSKVSTRQLHDRLRAHLGMTAQSWIERRRLDVAKQRLSTEDTSFKEIAFALGFRHPPHFTAWFKRHTTLTPSAFRSGDWVEAA
jgi:AraC-like DNA-binding protein